MSATLRTRVLSRLMIDPSGCLLWTGSTNSHGYGHVSDTNDGEDQTLAVHRLMYEWFVGPIPDGRVPDHLCRVRHCGAPAHLEAVTQHENTMRGVSPSAVNATKDACDDGHDFTPENTYVWRGQRHCRTCRRNTDRSHQPQKTEYMREWRSRNRERLAAEARARRARKRGTAA